MQGNHLHLIIEAADARALGRGMQGLGIRLAKGLNKLMGRAGRVLADRYHAHILCTPTEVKRAVHYVRNNQHKHVAQRGGRLDPRYVDPYSSRSRGGGPGDPSSGVGLVPIDLPAPRTWLLTHGIADLERS